MVVVNGQSGGAKTPLRDLIDGALKRMEAGATMELGCIPNDSSRSWSIHGDHVTKEIARLVKLGMKLDQHVPHMTNDDIRLLIVETTTKALMNHRMVSDEVFNALRLKNLLAMTPDDRQDGWAAMQMISEAIEELFGPKASLESSVASLLRGPEFHHRAEGIVEALRRVAAVLPASIPRVSFIYEHPVTREPIKVWPKDGKETTAKAIAHRGFYLKDDQEPILIHTTQITRAERR